MRYQGQGIQVEISIQQEHQTGIQLHLFLTVKKEEMYYGLQELGSIGLIKEKG